jgi:hypothetical protein
MIDPFWGKFFIGYLLVGSIALYICGSIQIKVLTRLKKEDPNLYEEIRQEIDEGWTKPDGVVMNQFRDGPMGDRLHLAIIERRCMAQISEKNYWVFRLLYWVGRPLPYVFFSFVIWFVYKVVQMGVS